MAQADTTDESTNGSRPRPTRPGRSRRRWRDGRTWRRGHVLAVCAVLVAALLFFHSAVPNRSATSAACWRPSCRGWARRHPGAAGAALARRSATALMALVLPALVWADLFGGLLDGKNTAGGDLTVVTHNVNAGNPDPAGTAADIARSGAGPRRAGGADRPQALPVYERVLAAHYPYRAVEGTVALWSSYPLHGTAPVDIRLGWIRALRTTVDTPHGQVAVYVAHMPSVRVQLDGGFTANQRDDSADALGDAIAAEKLHDVLLMGDLNGTMNDRSLAPITSQMRSAQGAAGDGFGFSWPAAFPMARIDQIMVKGFDPTRSWVLPRTGSDHLPVAATLRIVQ